MRTLCLLVLAAMVFFSVLPLSLAQNECVPTGEVCDGKDNDCDERIDYFQEPGDLTRECGPRNETGICGFGYQICSVGEWGICREAVYPEIEVCDGLDNNCNGFIDEGVCEEEGVVCFDGEKIACGEQGVCKPSYRTCRNNEWGPCTGRAPSLEVCDGKDNDCDWQIDEGCSCVDGDTRFCGSSSDTGMCTFGLSVCSGGVWGECMGSNMPCPEVCDGVDNDCDGIVDEDCVEVETALQDIGFAREQDQTGTILIIGGLVAVAVGAYILLRKRSGPYSRRLGFYPSYW